VVVVDASALVAFFLREEGWRGLARYMVRAISVGHAVEEFYNAVWRSVRLRGVIGLEEAREIIGLFNSYREKNMVLEPEEKYVGRAFEIAVEHGITVYDSLYLAQALHHGKPLLSLDERQRAVASSLGLEVVP